MDGPLKEVNYFYLDARDYEGTETENPCIEVTVK